jgi:nucleoside 2-deoxyribosyltransferase
VNVYVASSWRNQIQPHVVAQLRAAGHSVYDFKNPLPGNHGFHWEEIDPKWKSWTAGEFRQALSHEVAEDGFALDMEALKQCDACVLVLPCGRSAHLELGWACGRGKFTVALVDDPCEPELMYKMLDAVCLSVDEVIAVLAEHSKTYLSREECDRLAAEAFDHSMSVNKDRS